jgi:hypothetical protein
MEYPAPNTIPVAANVPHTLFVLYVCNSTINSPTKLLVHGIDRLPKVKRKKMDENTGITCTIPP